ncbi:MAG TPA: xanthine dehydrogenase family protein subunit M [Dehalococcoidia bacterium]|nr:xanthine dehydrogenase family protein subunit M [Dehalococcoidia bacterium]
MIPSAFEYHSPTSVEDAIGLLGQFGDDAKLLAGGHSLIPLMKLRLAAPEHLIDLGRVQGLSYIRDEGGTIAIGAMTTHSAVSSSELLRSRLAVLAESAASIGDVQVRNRGTIGGSLAHADPGADLPGVMLALNADLAARGAGGTRTIAAPEFFTGLLSTALEPNEVLTEIRIPTLPANSGSIYLKFANQASGYAIVGIAAIVTLSGGNVSDVRVGVSGVGETASRATGTEQALRGQPATAEAVKRAAQRAADGIEPLGDIHASAEYRSHLVRVFAERALNAAIARAQGRG